MKSPFSMFGWTVSIALHAVALVCLFSLARLTSSDSGEAQEPTQTEEPDRAENPGRSEEPAKPEPSACPAPSQGESQYAPLPPSERPFPEMKETPPARTESSKASPKPGRVKPASPEPSEPEKTKPAAAAASSSGETVLYTVKPGESLTAIAKRSGTTLEELAKLNKTTVKKLSKLWVGQRIRIPAAK